MRTTSKVSTAQMKVASTKEAPAINAAIKTSSIVQDSIVPVPEITYKAGDSIISPNSTNFAVATAKLQPENQMANHKSLLHKRKQLPAFLDALHTSQFDEFNKLINEAHVKDMKIKELQLEIRTMKHVNYSAFN